MEEILASIRRIISEDEPAAEGAEEAAAAAPEAAPEPEPAPVKAEEPPPPPEPVAVTPPPEPEPEPAPVAAAVEEDDDELELTQKVETVGDLDVVEHEPAAPEAPGLVSQPAALAAASAFGALSAAIGMPRTDRTLEDVVRELLQPLLKQWLDDNLPKIVQESVQAEVERISRARVR
jgi:cell pole-organizing protein PopZ